MENKTLYIGVCELDIKKGVRYKLITSNHPHFDSELFEVTVPKNKLTLIDDEVYSCKGEFIQFELLEDNWNESLNDLMDLYGLGGAF